MKEILAVIAFVALLASLLSRVFWEQPSSRALRRRLSAPRTDPHPTSELSRLKASPDSTNVVRELTPR